MAAGNQQILKHLFLSFPTNACSLEELIKIKVIFILRQGMFG